MGKREIGCDNCGETLERYPSHINEHNFCNRECHSEWMSENLVGEAHPRHERVSVECDQCGDEIEKIPALANRDQDHHFCNPGCKGDFYREHPELLHEKERVDVDCANCGTTFEVIPYRAERGAHNFCDPDCRVEWLAEHQRGEDHPNWTGGFEDYYGENWFEQRRKARKRDRYECFLCGLSDGASEVIYGRELDVHHVQRKDDFDDLTEANHVANLLTVCLRCHPRPSSS